MKNRMCDKSLTAFGNSAVVSYRSEFVSVVSFLSVLLRIPAAFIRARRPRIGLLQKRRRAYYVRCESIELDRDVAEGPSTPDFAFCPSLREKTKSKLNILYSLTQ